MIWSWMFLTFRPGFFFFFLRYWLFPVHRFVTAREINGWRLLLPCPSYKHPPPPPGFTDLFSVTFQLWPGSSSASQADPRQWSFWATTQCLVNYKVTQHWSGSRWNVQPPPPHPHHVSLCLKQSSRLEFCKGYVESILALQLSNYVFSVS